MVCNPADTNITMAPPGPGPSIPGLGLPFSIPKRPFGDISMPEGVPEDLMELIDQLTALFPNGIKFQPNTNSMTKGVWDALSSLFNQMAPFLGLYKFIQALLNIILCIIDIFCALMNPWATLRAVKRLFKRCLPAFLSLFPWIALLVMILSLVLLLIALIEYIIEVIVSYIQQIIRNLKILARAIQVHDTDSILAAVQKISFVLCLIEQLFTLLMGISALLAIIQPLMRLLGRSVCSGGDRNGNGAGDCCTPDFCPSFIRNNPDGLMQASGRLIYQCEIDSIVPTDPVFDFLRNSQSFMLRPQRWQFVDDHPSEYKFLDIITPSPEYGFIYWPNNDVFEHGSNLIRVPYKLDMFVRIDPRHFGNPNDFHGERLMNIRDVIVRTKPTTYATAWNNGSDLTANSGCLSLVGGSVYEFTNDGYVPYQINGIQATLETLITQPSKTRNSLPVVDDGYDFLDIIYTLKVNHEVLIQHGLIGLMCQPDIASESAVLNAEYNDIRSVLDKVGDLPDVDGTVACLTQALSKFRGDLNENTAAIFQSEMTGCLNSLKTQSLNFYAQGTAAATDRFSSDFELSPSVQFIKNDINVTVRLRDKSGNQLATKITSEAAERLSSLIKAEPTFGNISGFVYDGYGNFVASLISDIAGTGEIKSYIDNEVIASVINRDNDNELSEIVERVLTYEFVDKVSYSPKQKFGDSDIAEDGS